MASSISCLCRQLNALEKSNFTTTCPIGIDCKKRRAEWMAASQPPEDPTPNWRLWKYGARRATPTALAQLRTWRPTGVMWSQSLLGGCRRILCQAQWDGRQRRLVPRPLLWLANNSSHYYIFARLQSTSNYIIVLMIDRNWIYFVRNLSEEGLRMPEFLPCE